MQTLARLEFIEHASDCIRIGTPGCSLDTLPKVQCKSAAAMVLIQICLFANRQLPEHYPLALVVRVRQPPPNPRGLSSSPLPAEGRLGAAPAISGTLQILEGA